MYTKGEWKFELSDLTIRSNDFKNGSQMSDYKGVIIADLKPALGCDYSDNVDLGHTGRSHAIPQTLANGHLIAAAPKMCEALKRAKRYVEREIVMRPLENGETLIIINEALAEAGERCIP